MSQQHAHVPRFVVLLLFVLRRGDEHQVPWSSGCRDWRARGGLSSVAFLPHARFPLGVATWPPCLGPRPLSRYAARSVGSQEAALGPAVGAACEGRGSLLGEPECDQSLSAGLCHLYLLSRFKTVVLRKISDPRRGRDSSTLKPVCLSPTFPGRCHDGLIWPLCLLLFLCWSVSSAGSRHHVISRVCA